MKGLKVGYQSKGSQGGGFKGLKVKGLKLGSQARVSRVRGEWIR